MSESAVLRNYGRVEEALIVCAALQYAGFDASIDNYNHATVNWLLVPALGGIPVRLPTSQLEDAKAYLREMVETAEERRGKPRIRYGENIGAPGLWPPCSCSTGSRYLSCGAS